MEQGDVVHHLMPVVPSVECSVFGVVVQHRDVGVLVLERDVNVLVGGGVGVKGVVDLRSAGVAVRHVESPADHESLSGTPFGMIGGPAPDHLKRYWVELADHDVSCVLIGGVDCPESSFVHHQIDVRMATP